MGKITKEVTFCSLHDNASFSLSKTSILFNSILTFYFFNSQEMYFFSTTTHLSHILFNLGSTYMSQLVLNWKFTRQIIPVIWHFLPYPLKHFTAYKTLDTYVKAKRLFLYNRSPKAVQLQPGKFSTARVTPALWSEKGPEDTCKQPHARRWVWTECSIWF